MLTKVGAGLSALRGGWGLARVGVVVVRGGGGWRVRRILLLTGVVAFTGAGVCGLFSQVRTPGPFPPAGASACGGGGWCVRRFLWVIGQNMMV